MYGLWLELIHFLDCFLLCSCFECSQFSEAVLHECESMSPGKQKDINPRNSKRARVSYFQIQ